MATLGNSRLPIILGLDGLAMSSETGADDDNKYLVALFLSEERVCMLDDSFDMVCLVNVQSELRTVSIG